MKFIEELTFDFIEFLPFHKRPFKARLIPAQIWIDLDLYKDNIHGLGDYCKKWKTKVRFVKDKSTSVGGEYDSIDNQCTLFIFSPKSPYVKFSRDTLPWKEFKYQFIQTLMHEMVHFMQYSNADELGSTTIYSYKISGNPKKDEEREYHSEVGEIQAYAHCIFLDLKTKSNEPIVELLKRCKTTRESQTLTSILETFDNDFCENYALHRLVKEIIRWDMRYNINNSYGTNNYCKTISKCDY